MLQKCNIYSLSCVAYVQHAVYFCIVIKKITRAATLNRETVKLKNYENY